MKTFVIIYFFDGHTRFDYKNFASYGDASTWRDTEQERMNAAGTDVSISINEK